MVRRMAKRKGTHWVLSAALTDTGAPVYLDPHGAWTRKLTDAQALDSEQAVAELVARAEQKEQRTVCDPYSFEAVLVDGVPTPLSARERIRRDGPSTRVRRPD